MTACTWDTAEGRLIPGAAVSTLAEPGAAPRNEPAAVVVSEDGGMLYVSNRGHDSIAAYSLADPTHPELVATAPSGGRGPRDLTLHPNGRWLYAVNEQSGLVCGFALDPDTGVPRIAGPSLASSAASCLVLDHARPTARRPAGVHAGRLPQDSVTGSSRGKGRWRA